MNEPFWIEEATKRYTTLFKDLDCDLEFYAYDFMSGTFTS